MAFYVVDAPPPLALSAQDHSDATVTGPVEISSTDVLGQHAVRVQPLHPHILKCH